MDSNSSLQPWVLGPSTSRIVTAADMGDHRKGSDDVSSLDGRASTTTVRGLPPSGTTDSKNKNYKLREKIRSRLQLAKGRSRQDEMGDAAEAEDRHLRRRLDQRLKQRSAIAADPESGLDSEAATSKEFFPSSEESYAFFTCCWEEHGQSPAMSPGVSPVSSRTRSQQEMGRPAEFQGSQEHVATAAEDTTESPGGVKEKDVQRRESENGESTKLLVEDLITVEDRWQIVGYAAPMYRPFREQVTEEKVKYFVPSTTEVPVSDKLPEGVVPRHLADEGLYVGKPFQVDARNRNVVEHRLLKNKELQWFGEDGQILALPDVVDRCPLRPMVNEGDEPPIKVDFKKAEHAHYGDSADYSPSTKDGMLYQLDISVGQLSFSHHSLFSHEHVLASKLTTLYKQYCCHRETNTLEFLARKLDVLRSAVASVQEASQLLVGDRETESETQRTRLNRLRMYRREIRVLRQNLDREHRVSRTTFKNIIRTWRSIKSLREAQGYVNTPVQIRIIRKEVDSEADRKAWQDEIDAEVRDEREDYELSHQEMMEEYRRKLKQYKKSKLLKKKRERKRKARDGQDEGSTVIESEGEGPDAEEEVTGVASKPELPSPFDEREVRERIRDKALQIRRNPGESILHPELTFTASITSPELCPKKEQKRRAQVLRCKIFARILCDAKEVTQTDAKTLNQDFTVSIGEVFSLRVRQPPKCLTIQLEELHQLSNNLLAEVYLPFPAAADEDAASRLKFDEFQFSSDRVMTHGHEGVGSGVAISAFNAESSEDENAEIMLFTSGSLSCRVAWGRDPEGKLLAPAASEGQPHNVVLDPIGSLGATDVTDPVKLKRWIDAQVLDPNDPFNVALMRHLKDETFLRGKKDYFRLEPLQEEFNFVQDDDFFRNRRFRVLRYRNDGIPEFKNLRMVPMNERDISAELFKTYEKRRKEEVQLPSDLREDTDIYQQKVTQHLNKIKEEVWRHYQQTKHRKELSDLVSEDAIPDIGSLGMSLIKLTEKKRPLRPIRKERKRITAQNVGGAPVAILVNVASAFHVPVRQESERGSRLGLGRQPTVTNINVMEEPLVRPVVEVTFQRTTLCTSISSGPNPCWNQDLKFEFRSPNEDFSPSSLQTVKDVLYFNLFDEVLVDLVEDERDRDSLIHQRIERRWLGTLQLPFSTIYLNTRIEGTFKLDCQPFLLGYVRDTDARQAQLLGTSQSTPLEKDHTYLSVFVTLEPALPLPEPWKDKFESYESDKVLQRADLFKATFANSFPSREMKATVIDVNAKLVFVTRFLRPLPPPDELCNGNNAELAAASDDVTLTRVARFVSLIPVISEIAVFPGICDIWTTSDQFLSVLVGNQEEHAVLLCNYFLFLKMKSWLLLGFAVPEGRSIYVLTEDVSGSHQYRMWNACTGESFSVQDTFGPVQSIGCIVNEENIWLNVQQCCEPWRMSFNFHNSKHWRPFFDSGFPNPRLASIQPDRISYDKIDQSIVDKLREKVERSLRNAIMGWRKRSRTSWNRHSSRVLQKILEKMEGTKFGILKEAEIQSELQSIVSAYKMCGFPLSFPYTEMSAILDTVHATGVHLTEGPNLEFALAVHIHPYPHHVVAVWIYVASLHKR